MLEEAVHYINDHPNRQLMRRLENLDLHRAKRVDSSIRRAVVRGLGYGPQVEITGVGKVHSQIPAVRCRETLNTPEHKWLRLNLFMIAQHLAGLHAHIASEMQRHQASRRAVPKRLQVEEEELANFVGRIEELLALPVFNGIEELPPPGFASLSLLNGIGYSDAYRAISVLQMGLAIQGDDIDFSVRDVHDLYETWCFIGLVHLIAAKYAGAVDVSGLVRIEELGIRMRLKRGEKSEIEFRDESHGRKLLLSYNPSFSGLTGDQRPDVVLRIQQGSWPELIVVFDAKYRLNASEEYVRRFNSVGPPIDAINAIHRYRDAIVVESVERGLQRPVVKGAALFPLAAEDTGAFEASPLFRALEVLGVGALPFLPSNTEMVDRWLSVILSTVPEQLAEPGPPFAGLAERFRRHKHT
jgi:predicted component of viral defense system (DUF524 family)